MKRSESNKTRTGFVHTYSATSRCTCAMSAYRHASQSWTKGRPGMQIASNTCTVQEATLVLYRICPHLQHNLPLRLRNVAVQRARADSLTELRRQLVHLVLRLTEHDCTTCTQPASMICIESAMCQRVHLALRLAEDDSANCRARVGDEPPCFSSMGAQTLCRVRCARWPSTALLLLAGRLLLLAGRQPANLGNSVCRQACAPCNPARATTQRLPSRSKVMQRMLASPKRYRWAEC